MCGIAGIANFSGTVSAEDIKLMSNTLQHRGPDDEGFVFFDDENFITAGSNCTPSDVWASKHFYSPQTDINNIIPKYQIAFAHRRLAIIDLTPAGHQPMCTDDKQLWITYNGEIYNYIELRNELSNIGYRFKTNTDTEVILIAYKHWGADCLSHFNGMWAFVIYDTNKKLLFGSRDRFGVKPLYYYDDKKNFAFASEQKALHKLAFVNTSINNKVVFSYLVLAQSEPFEESMFKNIFEILPSHAFIYDLTQRSFLKWKYYTLQFENKNSKCNENMFLEYSSKINSLLTNAINIRLRSDAPVGSCLSGGLDSSSIVCMINFLLEKNPLTQIGDKQKVFTACYSGHLVDESGWAKKVVEDTKTSWFQTFPKATELLNDLEDIVYYQDIPFISSSTYAHYTVMKRIHEEGVKVTLDGQGGDEIFAGYEPFVVSYWMELLKNFRFKKLFSEFDISSNSIVSPAIFKYYILKTISVRYFPAIIKNYFLRNKAEYKYINDKFWNENKFLVSDIAPPVEAGLNKIMSRYTTGPLLKVLLKTSERNAMRFSVESRTPFADDMPLIEYLFMIPSEYKIYKNTTKYLLRAATKNILPEAIRLRKDKIGFTTPEYEWLNEIKTPLKAYFTNDLDEYFNVKKILNDWDFIFKQPSKNPFHLWRMINFAVWKKVYFPG